MNFNIRYIADGEEKRSTDFENADYKLTVDRLDGRTTISITAKKPMTLVTSSLKEPYRYPKDCQIYINGYQSWTDTREYDRSEKLRNMSRLPEILKKRYHFDAYGDSWFMRYEKDQAHSFTFTYIRKPDGSGDFIGSFNEQNSYLIVHHIRAENEMSIRSDCQYKKLEAEEEFCLYDYVWTSGPVQKLARSYFEQLGSCSAPPVRGYTSWYLHYQDINEEKMRKVLDSVSVDDFDLFQIDDGYETFVGDWMDIDPQKFPNGLKPIVDEIHAKGMKAGIWLAPFVCELKSRIFKEHPDWIYKEKGQDIFAGSNWSGDVVLDLRKREVQEYIRNCLEYYMSLGFDFFKLDFLYAAALIHEDRGFTRAEIMRRSMEALRIILKDRLILGCGVPLSSAFNLVDYCRIGPDVSLKFDDVFYMRMMHRERISTKNTLQNTIYRSVMDGTVFRCDPDVYLLRDDNIELSKEQRKALVMINHLCGAVYMTSDDVGSYDAEKKAILKEAQTLQDAQITDIKKTGDLITVTYELNGEESRLVYDRKTGKIN